MPVLVRQDLHEHTMQWFDRRIRHRLHAAFLNMCQHVGGWGNRRYAGLFTRADEVGFFRQEAVAGMQAVCADLLRDSDQRRAVVKVGIELDSLIRQPDMQGTAIRRLIQRHRLDPHFLTGAHDAHGNFAAIGDEHFLEHLRLPRRAKSRVCG